MADMDKIKLLQQLRDSGKITDDMYKQNISKLLGSDQLPTLSTPEVPKGMNWKETRDYNKILAQREQNNIKNAIEGRTGDITGRGRPLTALEEVQTDNLKNMVDIIRAKGGATTNLENTVKSTSPDMIGISPEVRSKFPSTNLKLNSTGQEIGQAGAKAVEEAVSKEGPALQLLKGSKGFAGVAPMVGMGVGALAAMPIAKKLQDQDWKGAATDTAEMGANMAFPVASAIFNSPEAGAAELPDSEMNTRNVYNNARQKDVSQSSNQQPLLQPEEPTDRANSTDLQEAISKFKNTMGRIK